MSKQNNIRQILKGHAKVPVVTITNQDDPVALMRYLMEQNIFCIEVTLRTPEGILAIEKLKDEFGDEIVAGAGTVTNTNQVRALRSVGANFMVSPGLTTDLHLAMEYSNIPYLPGASTPSEIIRAKELGLNTLKFFPANLFGGLDAVKAYGQVFPEVAFCPTGGITEANFTDYLNLTNVFAVGGTWFQKQFKAMTHI